MRAPKQSKMRQTIIGTKGKKNRNKQQKKPGEQHQDTPQRGKDTKGSRQRNQGKIAETMDQGKRQERSPPTAEQTKCPEQRASKSARKHNKVRTEDIGHGSKKMSLPCLPWGT